MLQRALSSFVETTAAEFGIPGAAVGIWSEGREVCACQGVTSIDNPLPVDEHTLFIQGSITKTYTASALMRLVAEGRVALDAPVKQYVPEFELPENAAANITVLSLLNHTAGLDWRIDVDTGEGDDALAREVAKLAEAKLIAPPGTRASYSQAGYDLAGRVLEKVAGLTYEAAIGSLLLEPLGQSHSSFLRDDIMTQRFAVGHSVGEHGQLAVARPWRHWRSDNPGAGLAASVSDQLRWARFHLGDGKAPNGVWLMPTGLLKQMQRPTVALQGSSLGDALGICWFLREVDGVQTVGHGGSANGQFADMLLVPERDFAVVVMSNAGPNGIPFNKAVIRWALRTYAGIIDRDAEPLPYDAVRAQEIVGRYENEYMTFTIETDGTALRLDVRIKPEIRAAAKAEPPADVEPADFGLLPGSGDQYVVTNGSLAGMRGFFTRGDGGQVVGVDMAGRLFRRISALNG